VNKREVQHFYTLSRRACIQTTCCRWLGSRALKFVLVFSSWFSYA